jgi:hypothetical protein
VSRRAQTSATFRPVSTLRLHASGERDLVDARLAQRRPGLAVSGQDLKHPFGQPGRLEDLAQQLPGEGRHLGRLQDDRVPRHQRLDAGIQRENHRRVPRADHADHAERSVLDPQRLLQAKQSVQLALLGPQDLSGALRVVGECVAGREYRHHDRLGSRLARLPNHHVHDLVLALEQHAERSRHAAGPRLEGERAPRGLRLARGLDGEPRVLGGLDLDLSDRLERRGARELQAASRSGRGLERRHDGHEQLLSHWRFSEA